MKQRPDNKQTLIRIKLQRHSQKTIREEVGKRVTNIKPWSRATEVKAYAKMGTCWDLLEEAALRAQTKPEFLD